ncbi:hypothetical protein Agabi119p4_8279 [Agaricus bisporus var. burnettii]|uniref:Uncharacterized protein n=1 Tax=Agaricus bisporus var. burnettii TaxID=192524 RepID=A0A8H7C6F5_AGABI|nr:hypothetical protein Agabi119p4_8279 [Agaricus bisporus var. burnettii]
MAPAVLHGLLPGNMYQAWLCLCRLAPIVYQPSIPDRAAYDHQLREAINDLLAAAAMWNTQWFNKPKFHILLHLPHHVERFGPPVLAATEGFESYNYVIRLRSIHSNRSAPSQDIARVFSHLLTVRHLISGGWVLGPTGTTGTAKYRQAGIAVRDLLQDKTLCSLLGMTEIMEVGLAPVKFHYAIASNPIRWNETQTSTCSITPPDTVTPHSWFRQCDTLIISNSDKISVAGYMLFSDEHSQVAVSQVAEILVNVQTSCIVGVLVKRMAIHEACVSPYMFPAIRPTTPVSWYFCTLSQCQAAVSVIHNCANHDCRIGHVRPVYQERHATAYQSLGVIHDNEHDLLLNLAQLRSSAMLRGFHPAIDHPSHVPRQELVALAIDHHDKIIAAETGTREKKGTRNLKRKRQEDEEDIQRKRQPSSLQTRDPA